MGIQFTKIALTSILCLSWTIAAKASFVQCISFLRPAEQSVAIQRILEDFNFPSEFEMRTSNRDLRLAIYNAFGGKDFYTGQRMSYQEMTLDHILPKSKGGPNNLYNYVPTSQLVNGHKGNIFDEVATIAVLSIVRTVYADKVLRELDTLSRLPEETKLAMHKSEDPRKLAINETGSIVDRAARTKRIQLIEPLSEDFKVFLMHLRDVSKETPSATQIIGPSAVIKVNTATTMFSLEGIRAFQRSSEVKTEIQFSDQVTQVMKTYALIQNIETIHNSNIRDSNEIRVLITRKLFEKFIQLNEVEFKNFLESGILVENNM